MPRLTNQQYLNRHTFLRAVWLDLPELFAIIPAPQQREVHRFYRPADELPDADLLRHRDIASKDQPSLPQQASKGLRAMHEVFTAASATAAGDHDQLRRTILDAAAWTVVPSPDGPTMRVTGISKAGVDVDKLVAALFSIASSGKSRSCDTSAKNGVAV